MTKSIFDKIDEITSGKVIPVKKDKTPKTAMRKRIKEVVEGKKKAPAELQRAAEKSLAILDEVRPLTARPVKDAEDFKLFDMALARIVSDRKAWKEGVEKILIPMREAKEAVHSLDRATDRPKENMELAIRKAMADWVRHLDAIKAQEQKLIDDEAVRLRTKAEEAQAKADAAKTVPMRARLVAQVQQLTQQAEAVAEIEPEAHVEAENSHAKRPMKWKVTSLTAIIKAVAAGDLPEHLLELDTKMVNFYFKTARNEMADWPGIEIFEDVQIVSGQRWKGQE